MKSLSPGARTFGVVWFGQLVSNLGSGMTSFGLAVWVYQETGSALQLGLLISASRIPMILVSPFAGALVDRWDRRKAMLVSDTGVALSTLAAFLLIATGRLEIWHLYVILAFGGAFQAFQFPAYSAAVTTLVPKEQYTRASGFVQMANNTGRLVAPALAASLVVSYGLGPIFLVDLLTFGVAIATLVVVRFPQTAGSASEGKGLRALAAEAKNGWTFVAERSALLYLLLSFVVVSFAFAFYGVLAIPLLIESFDAQTAGLVVSFGSGALFLGSVALSAWGGPKNRIAGVYLPILAMGIGLVLIGWTADLFVVMAGVVLMYGTHPIAGGSAQSIWQSKVPTHLQGRVFAVRQATNTMSTPVAFLVAGVLAEKVFEPLMQQPGTWLTALLGSGPGRGIGLMMVGIGCVGATVAALALSRRRIKNLELEIPDIDLSDDPADTPSPGVRPHDRKAG